MNAHRPQSVDIYIYIYLSVTASGMQAQQYAHVPTACSYG